MNLKTKGGENNMKKTMVSLVVGAAMLLLTTPVFADSTHVVMPGDMATNIADVIAHPTSWFFYNDETDTIDNTLGSFVTGPSTPPTGVGSVQISVTGTQRRNLATYQFSGTALADITTLAFSTFNPSIGNGGSANRSGYLNFNVDFNGTDTWQKRLVYVPSDNGTVVQDSWQEWDTINGGAALWKYSGSTWPGTVIPGTTSRTWSDILSSYPGVRIRVTDSWLGVRVGEPYADGYTENIDAFKFGTASGVTTFDFDVETIAPTADFVFPTPGSAAISFQVVFSEPVKQTEAENAANYFLNNWPGAGGSGDLAGDATVVYNSTTHTATVTFLNPAWYVSPEQQWGVQNIHDLAGNLINLNPTTEYSTAMVAPNAPGIPVTVPNPTISLSQTWNWTAAVDPGGVDASGVKYYQYRLDGGVTWTNLGNVLTVNTSFGVGTHTFGVRAIDNAGNVGIEAVGSVQVFKLFDLTVTKAQCMNNGWQVFGSETKIPMFKNQGDCVSYIVSNPNAVGNKKNN